MIWVLTSIAFLGTTLLVAGAFHAISCRRQLWQFVRVAQRTKVKGATGQPMQKPERRRGERLALHVPLVVFGFKADGGFFHEETTTQQVNAYGGLLCLSTNVKTGESLWLTNKLTLDQRECHVVRLELRRLGKTDVGIELAQPVPDFWRADS